MKVKEANLEYKKKYELSREEIEAIKVGIADMEAGRVMSHEDAMRQIRESLGIDKI